MDETTSFDELTNSFPAYGMPGNPSDSFSIRSKPENYVKPRFTEQHSTEGASVTLISARGAAGKSTTANELSYRLKSPVWRLQDDKAVGYASVEHALTRYLNNVDPLPSLKQMPSPQIIVDSTDEARAVVSAQSWEQFIDALVTAHASNLGLIILGRTRTITDLWARLEDKGVATRWFEISHFDREASDNYVDHKSRQLDGKADINNTAYIQAKTTVIEALRNQDQSSDSDMFVGYPPVLDAVSALLVNKSNLQQVTNSFSEQQNSRKIEVLQKILAQLVEREQTKIRPVLDELSIASDELFSQGEQFQWLLHCLEGQDQPALEYIPDPATRHEYQTRISSFLEDHPFRNGNGWASPVFRAYVVYANFHSLPGHVIHDVATSSGMVFEFTSGIGIDPPLVTEVQFAALHKARRCQLVEATLSFSRRSKTSLGV